MSYPDKPGLIGLISKGLPAAFGHGVRNMSNVNAQVQNMKA